MKSSKTLTSAVVAAAMIGGIGLAYAQTNVPQNGTQDPAQTMQSAPVQPLGASTGSTMSNQSTSSMNSGNMGSSTDASVTTERPAQADRN